MSRFALEYIRFQKWGRRGVNTAWIGKENLILWRKMEAAAGTNGLNLV